MPLHVGLANKLFLLFRRHEDRRYEEERRRFEDRRYEEERRYEERRHDERRHDDRRQDYPPEREREYYRERGSYDDRRPDDRRPAYDDRRPAYDDRRYEERRVHDERPPPLFTPTALSVPPALPLLMYASLTVLTAKDLFPQGTSGAV